VVSHPFASTIVTVQFPGQSWEMVLVPSPWGDPGPQSKVNAPVPPVGATLAVPLHDPAQMVFVTTRLGTIAGTSKRKVVSKAHRFASVRCSVFPHVQSALKEAPVPTPLLQE
jgi:hypothetical protein